MFSSNNNKEKIQHKKYLEEFEKIFFELKEYSSSEGVVIEKSRKKLNKKNEKILLIILVIINIIFFIGIFKVQETFLNLFLYSFLGLIGLIFWIAIKEIVYSLLGIVIYDEDKFKNKIMIKFLNLIDENLRYMPEVTSHKLYFENMLEIYRNETSFENRFYKFILGDYIEGFFENNIYFRMCDFETKIEENSKNEQTIYRPEDTFQFVCVDIPKRLNTNIRVMSIPISNPEKKLEMDSISFEKKFDVYTENKLEAMKILTSDIMEIMLEIRKEIIFDIEFKENQIYFRFLTESLFEYTTKKEKYYQYYCILKFIFELVEKVTNNINEKNYII